MKFSNIAFRRANPSHGHKRRLEFALLSFCLITFLWLGVSIGASNVNLLLPLESIYSSLLGTFEPSITQSVVLNIRLPRVVMALLVGAALAVSGASLQGVCRNPLADPGLLGISAGAAVGAVMMILFANHVPFLNAAGPYAVSIAAFSGAAIATFSVYSLAQVNGDIQIPTFLLAGVAINALAGAMIGGMSFIADDQALRLIINPRIKYVEWYTQA